MIIVILIIQFYYFHNKDISIHTRIGLTFSKIQTKSVGRWVIRRFCTMFFGGTIFSDPPIDDAGYIGHLFGNRNRNSNIDKAV